jgi:hypothetical protein
MGYMSAPAQQYNYLRTVDNVDIYYSFNDREQMMYLRLTNNGSEKVYAGPENILWFNGEIQVARQNGGGITLKPGETSGFGLFWTYPKGYQQGYMFRLENFKVEIGGQGKDPRYSKSSGPGKNKNNTGPLPEIVFPGDASTPTPAETPKKVSSPGQSVNVSTPTMSTTMTGTVAPVGPPASTVNSVQRQQYQNQANFYLNASQNDNQSAISRQLNLDLAKTNTYMSGDARQLQRVQQQQNLLNQQNNQQLAQSTANLIGAVSDLIEAKRQRKLERDREMQAWEARNREEERQRQQAYSEVMSRIQPVRDQSLAFIDRGIELDSTSYEASSDPVEKLCFAASWILKKRERVRVANSRPDLQLFDDGSYLVNSPGYITPSSIALTDASQLTDSFSLDILKPDFYQGEGDFHFTLDLPYKARQSPQKMDRFLWSDKPSFDILYERSRRKASESYSQKFLESYVADVVNFKYVPDSAQNYRREFQETYVYYRGHGWKSIYKSGYWAVKKIDAWTIYGNIILDSAIRHHDIAGVIRAATQYSLAVAWYHDNFSAVEPLSHPVYLLDRLFFSYTSAIMILRKATAEGRAESPNHTEKLIEKYLADFGKYLNLTKSH